MARRFPLSRLRDAAPLFAALGDPTRLALIALLASGGPASIAVLTGGVDVSRQAVTKHLHVLAGAGLVRGLRSGREHVWQLEPKRLAAAQDYLAQIDAQWDAALQRLQAYLGEG